MAGASELDVLNEGQYLYLRDISEPRDNALRLLVEEAVSNASRKGRVETLGDPGIDALLRGASPIESTAECRAFELRWKRYAAYLVTEECVASCGEYDDEVYSGKNLRVYTKSHFLEHLARDTGGHSEPLLHYKLVCLNHVIDIASYAPPEIREIEISTDGVR